MIKSIVAVNYTHIDIFRLLVATNSQVSEIFDQRDICAYFVRMISDILGTFVERAPRMSSSGTNRDKCFMFISVGNPASQR